MKIKSSLTAFVLVCGLWLAAGCRPDARVALTVRPLDSNTIASVQGGVISRESYRQKLKERVGQTVAPLSGAAKEAVLEAMIRQEAVYAQAKAAKFDAEPEVAALIRNLIVSRFLEREMSAEEPRVTPEEVQQYYNEHGEEFVMPATARGAIMFFRAAGKMAPEKRAALQQQASLILAEAGQITQEADFARLVQRHSEHQATRYRGGDLGWMTREQCEVALGAGVSAALFALKRPNSFAPLLETPDGFYILKLRALQEPRLRPLAEVEEFIRYRLLRQQRSRREEEFYTRMKQGLDIRINQALLESISLPRPEDHPPGLPGSSTAQRIVTR
jgi:hypothetical protein